MLRKPLKTPLTPFNENDHALFNGFIKEMGNGNSLIDSELDRIAQLIKPFSKDAYGMVFYMKILGIMPSPDRKLILKDTIERYLAQQILMV